VAVAAELPWLFLRMLCRCAREECRALLVADITSGDDGASLPLLLHRATQHAVGLLQETALHELYVRTSLQPLLLRCRRAFCVLDDFT
jgi:hypothetical protein